MAKIYKAEVYVVDIDDKLKEGYNVAKFISKRLSGVGIIKSTYIKESEEFEWDNDLKINSIHSRRKDFEKYFKGGNNDGLKQK